MRKLLALLLTLCTLPTFADASRGQCIPYVECKPLAVKSVKGPLAIHAFWFIRSPKGTIWHQGFSCPLAVCDLSTFTSKAHDVMAGKITPAEARAELQGFTCDYSNFKPIAGEHPICAERKDALVQKMDEWLAGIPAQLPWWRVKANGAFPSRPAYTLAGTVRGTKEVARAEVGTPCDVSKPTLASGSDLWAEFGTAAVVALCQKVNP
ncbi:MAG: hypothetical protein Q8S12_00300 [Hydrogenophaga sp.]|uniref:hypothetical protein n=1 Tax=Hydrogenophaga sp. TaxID=1904254 RepID=UPI0027332B80|nr:hypothetical protein [Hydrogenophaga sp.]MDP3625006.1 hypothetical protein [Hydrogenophaga sp.]